jgi:type IX secretion system PorP/SprF family membrane protein
MKTLFGKIIIVIMFCNAFVMRSQDMHFSQFYASRLYLNPAFTGANVCSRVSLIYRNQWTGVSTAYRSYIGSFDHYFPNKNIGIGLQFGQDVAGTGALKTTIINPLIAYETKLSRKFALRFGAQPGITIKSIDMNRLTFGDQLYRGGNVTTIESPVISRTYFDFGAGTLLYGAGFWLGTSVYHINRPDESLFSTGYNRIPIRYSVHGGYKYNLNRDETPGDIKKSITAAFNYRGQAKFDQFDIGFYFTRAFLNVGMWYRGIPGLKAYKTGYKNNDAFIFIIGLEGNRIDIGYSYDITISDLSTISHGSHELTLNFQMCRLKEKKKKAELIECPKF